LLFRLLLVWLWYVLLAVLFMLSVERVKIRIRRMLKILKFRAIYRKNKMMGINRKIFNKIYLLRRCLMKISKLVINNLPIIWFSNMIFKYKLLKFIIKIIYGKIINIIKIYLLINLIIIKIIIIIIFHLILYDLCFIYLFIFFF
jgi:hypothetical protein